MKKILLLFCMVIPVHLSAQMVPGKFLLWQYYSDNEPDNPSKSGIKIILDEGSVLGRFALIYEVVSKECKAIPAPERLYKLTHSEDHDCNVKSY